MAIRNNHWYNINEQRSYPLDDTASCRDDNDVRLPNDFLADLRLSWPLSYGRYCYLSAASCTPTSVSLIFSSCSDLDNLTGDSQILCGLNLPRNQSRTYETYSLRVFPLGPSTADLSLLVYDSSYLNWENFFLAWAPAEDTLFSGQIEREGIGGHVVFGSGIEQEFSCMFSSPRQSLITARAGRATIVSPVSKLRLGGSSKPYTGLLDLSVTGPMYARKEPQSINGKWQENVIVLGLDNTRATPDEESVFSRFAGRCSPRVSSGSCGDPQPLQSINGVRPDCDGNVTLDFRGCAVVGRSASDCGVILDCNLGLEQSCRPPYLPDASDGLLPGEYDPVNIPPLPPDSDSSDGPDTGISDSFSPSLALPYCDTFDGVQANSFTQVGSSMFVFIADDSPAEDVCCNGPPEAASGFGCDESDSVSSSPVSYGTNSPSARAFTHISLFTADNQTLFRQFVTDLRIQPNVTGTDNVAGILVNYKFGGNGLPNYYVAAVDTKTFTFGIYLFNGLAFVPLVQEIDYAIRINEWMRVRFSVVPTSNSVSFTANLQGITRPSLNVALSTSVPASQWGTDSGQSGFYIRKSLAHFAYWRVESAS